MKRLSDFKKICPVCLGFSISRTKRECDFCHAFLVDVENWNMTCEYNGKSLFRFVLEKPFDWSRKVIGGK